MRNWRYMIAVMNTIMLGASTDFPDIKRRVIFASLCAGIYAILIYEGKREK